MANPAELSDPTEIISIARDALLATPDERSTFEVYLDVANCLVAKQLSHSLPSLSVRDALKEDLITAEAYPLAYSAYLDDSGGRVWTATWMAAMLLEVFPEEA